MKKTQQGFSLMELLIVLVIMGLLAAIVYPRFSDRAWKARQKTAKTQISQLETTLETYRLDTGKYPTTEQGLQALMVKPQNVQKWEGPYLTKELPSDPWGNPYHYKAPGDHGPFDIISFGSDGKPGGEGEDTDIVSWKNIGE